MSNTTQYIWFSREEEERFKMMKMAAGERRVRQETRRRLRQERSKKKKNKTTCAGRQISDKHFYTSSFVCLFQRDRNRQEVRAAVSDA